MKAGIRVWPEMFRELADFRGLIWRLVVRDLSAPDKLALVIFGKYPQSCQRFCHSSARPDDSGIFD